MDTPKCTHQFIKIWIISNLRLWLEKKKSPLKDIQILIPRTCKSYKNIFADVIKLRILWWEDYPRLLWWALNAIPFIIIFIRVR